MTYIFFLVVGASLGDAVAETSDEQVLLQRGFKAVDKVSKDKAAQKLDKHAGASLTYASSADGDCFLAEELCDNTNLLLRQCWDTFQGDEVCSEAICNPSGESLKLSCVEYMSNEFGCVAGRDPRQVYETEGFQASIAQALCNGFIDMCFEWAPVFVQARQGGQMVDCAEFTSATSHLWNGACTIFIPDLLLQQGTGASGSRFAWSSEAERTQANVHALTDRIRKNAASQGITEKLRIVNEGTTPTYEFEVMSPTQRCKADANLGVVLDRSVDADDAQECKDHCRGDMTCAGVNYSPSHGCELFSSFCKTTLPASFEGEGEAHRILRTPFLLTCSAGYELETEETPTPIGFCPGSILDNACVIPLDLADVVCNDLADCEGYMAPVEPGAIKEAELNNLVVLTKFATAGDQSFSTKWRSCKKAGAAVSVGGLCCRWPKKATRVEDCVISVPPTHWVGQSQESCEKRGNLVWLTESDAEPSDCTNSWGDCKNTKCCKDSNFECVRQGIGFAQCRRKGGQIPSRFDGTILNSDQIFCDSFHPQECKGGTKRINGAPLQVCENNKCDQTTCCVEDNCAKSGKDCSDGGCCQDPNDTCFLDVTTGSAECKPTADGCGASACSVALPPALPPDAFRGCSAGWADCSATACCESPQFECYKESATTGTCRPRGNGPSMVHWEAQGNYQLRYGKCKMGKGGKGSRHKMGKGGKGSRHKEVSKEDCESKCSTDASCGAYEWHQGHCEILPIVATVDGGKEDDECWLKESTVQQMAAATEHNSHSQADLLQQRLLERSRVATASDAEDRLVELTTSGKGQCQSEGCMEAD